MAATYYATAQIALQSVFRYIADELKAKLSARPDDIMINMVFVDRSDWSFGNGEPW